jgi:branched-chain amino acid transport system substrate-binding protein
VKLENTLVKKFVVACIAGCIGLNTAFSMATEPVKVAAIFAQTGIAVTNNSPHIEVIQLAVDQINSQGGVLGRPIELLLLDNKSSPIGANLAAKKAVELQVAAVIGGAWSSHSLQMAPVLQKAKIPMITGSATNPKVTRFGNYIFRACFIDSFQARAMAQFAYDDLNARTAAVLEIINEEFSLTLAELFENSFSKLGGKIILKDSYENDAVDFADLLKKVKASQPDIVYVPGYARDSGLLLKQAASMAINTAFLGADGWAGSLIYDFGGGSVEGNYYSAHWHHDVSFSKSIELQKMYEQKYSVKIPHMNAPLTYDAMLLLADAIERAGTFEREKIRDALASTSSFQGATGTITFNDQGDPINKPVVIMKLGQEEPMYFKTVRP